MIEILSEQRCIGCNMCVRVCPMNVFAKVPGGKPVIARQDDCQTCFMCELYCPTDALFVAASADATEDVSEAAVEAAGLFGGYSRAMGWECGKAGGSDRDPTHRLRNRG